MEKQKRDFGAIKTADVSGARSISSCRGAFPHLAPLWIGATPEY